MKLLTVSGAAHRLRKSEATIRRWADSGRLRVAVRLSDGSRLFQPADLDAFMNAPTKTGGIQ